MELICPNCGTKFIAFNKELVEKNKIKCIYCKTKMVKKTVTKEK